MRWVPPSTPVLCNGLHERQFKLLVHGGSKENEEDDAGDGGSKGKPGKKKKKGKGNTGQVGEKGRGINDDNGEDGGGGADASSRRRIVTERDMTKVENFKLRQIRGKWEMDRRLLPKHGLCTFTYVCIRVCVCACLRVCV
jgi:hypothetical protein